jgi:arylsulfatase A-like enzyme
MKPAISAPVLILTGMLSGCSPAEKSNENMEHPNVLFFFADDQRADALGCSGNPYVKTPHIDKLAETGVRFSNTYVMGGHHGAICAPSRAMLLSGKSLFHVYDVLDGVKTMPMHFAEQGYETFGTGKWHNEKSAFEASFQYGQNVFLGGMSDHFQTPVRNLGADGKLSEPELKSFSTDLFAEAAMDFIHDYANGKRENPFFCYVSFTAPHDPRSPREDHIGIYSDNAMPLPGNFMDLHPFEFDNLNIRDETLGAWPRTPEMVKASLADYYALITHIDERVGEIISQLKESGLFESTIIVYAADNGLAVGSHGLLGKQNLYEHSTKVPFIISGPGIPQNKATDALVYLFDIYPTLAELCGLPDPEGIDGANLNPVIKGEKKGVREALYTAYRNMARAVRTPDGWKLISYPRRNFMQLFHLENDPLELNNLAEIPQYQQKLNEMKTLMEEWHQATNDTATLYPETFLPLEYDYTKLKQTPDRHQPEYVLERYFEN